MITIFSGEDYLKRKEAYKSYLDQIKEKGEVSFVTCEEEESIQDAIERFADGGGMFFEEVCVVVYDGLSIAKVKTKVFESIEKLKSSQTEYIFIENNSLTKEENKFFKENNVEVFEYKLTEKKEFNSFSLTDAILEKDKKKIWIEMNKIKERGEAAEATHGLVWWQIKSLLSVSLGLSQEEMGMKDYPYKKTKRALSHFKKEELITLSRDFVVLPVVARRKSAMLYEEMESFFLKNF